MNFLKSLTHPPKTVFTTAYREYTCEGHELNVLDHTLLPIGNSHRPELLAFFKK